MAKHRMARGLAGMFLAWGTAACLVFPAEAGTNLLKNPEFSPAKENPSEIPGWSIRSASWQRKEIVAFQGHPFPFGYLEMEKSGGVIRQPEISVEPNTWYVITAWYRAVLSASPAAGNNVWIFATPSGAAGYERIGGSVFGCSRDWVQARTMFNSGESKAVGLGVWFFGSGTAALGECAVRKLEDEDFKGPYFLDPEFEKGVEGNCPADFYALKDSPQPVIVSDGGFIRGRQSVKVVAPAGKNVFLYGPQAIPALPGTEFNLSCWVRASAPDTPISVTLQGPGGRPWRTRRDFKAGTEWTRIEMKATQAGREPAGIFFGANAPAQETTIWLDEFALEATPPFRSAEREGSVGRNRVLNGSFEAGLIGWDRRIFAGNAMDDTPEMEREAFEIDKTTAVEGTCSLKFQVPDGLVPSRFGGVPMGGYVVSAFYPAVAGEKYTVSFFAKAARPSDVRVSPTFPRLAERRFGLTTDWKRHHFEMVPEETREGNLQLHFRFPGSGTYWLDAVQVEKGGLSDFVPGRNLEVGAACAGPYAWHMEGEKAEAVVYACSRAKQESPVLLTWRVSDWRQRPAGKGSLAFTIPAGGTVTQKVVFPSESLGVFRVDLELKDQSSGETAAAPYLYGVFPAPTEGDPEKAFFGVHPFCMWWDRLALRGNYDDLYRMIRLCGARWTRDVDLGSWYVHEQEPGKWRWADRYVNAAVRNGVKIMAVLGSALIQNGLPMPGWAASEKKSAATEWTGLRNPFYPKTELWKNFVREYIRHYGDRIDAFEIMNETGGLEADEYVEFTKAAFEAAREVNAKARIVAPAYPCQGIPAGPEDNTWLGQVLKKGLYDYLDVYSPHLYPAGHYAKDYLESTAMDIQKSLEDRMGYLASAYGTKEVWDSESGHYGIAQLSWMGLPLRDESVRGVIARQQAERMVRWATIKKTAGVKRIFYHPGMNMGAFVGGGYNGLTEPNGDPRPVACAMAQMARRLDGTQSRGRKTVGEATLAHVFQGEGRVVLVYWNFETPEDGQVRMSVKPSDVQAEDLMGNPIRRSVEKGALVLPLDTSPVYLVSRTLSPEQLLATFVKSDILGVTPGQIAVSLSSGPAGPAVSVGVKNLDTRPLNLDAKVTDLPSGWTVEKPDVRFRDVPAGGQETVARVPLSSWGTDPKGMPLAVSAPAGNRVLEARRPVRVARAVKRTSPVTVDGVLAPEVYAGAVPIYLNRAEQVIASAVPWKGEAAGSATFRLLWDAEAVYAGIEVTDDHVENTAPTDLPFHGDCVEVYLDTGPDRHLFEDFMHDHQGKVFCVPAADAAGSGRWKISGGGSIEGIDAKNIRMVSRRTASGYTIELRIPVKGRKLGVGTVLGLDLSLIDFDSGRPERDRTQLAWSGKEPWANPHQWGFLLLE